MAKKKKSAFPSDNFILVDGKERFGNEIIETENIAQASMDYSCLFGANKNVYRIAPSLQDGLKPGKRRLFWSWWQVDNKPMNTKPETLKKIKPHKVETIASNTMIYHPHGSSASEELVGREGQYWNNNVMTIVPFGNYGNLESANPAAGRYITAKLSEYTIDCFFDNFDRYYVPMKPSYDGERMEPESFLPAKYPHILFNPQLSGIGYGLASNIPPFNLKEVLEATIKLIQNPKAKILLIPDSPTGADILDTGTFPEINKTGISSFTLRASYEIDYQENTIRFTSLPLQTKSKQVITNIINFKKRHAAFDEIIDIQDSTKEGEVDILFHLRSDANPDKVLETLFKKNTNLKMTYPVGITVIDDYVPYQYGVKDLLLEWIEYRRDTVRSMFMYSLQIIEEKQHMNKVLIMVFNKNNIERTVEIAKNSKTRKETIEKLMKEYKITSLQAAVIADMHVYNFNEEYYKKYVKEEKELEEELDKINEYLLDDDKIDEFIIDQLKEGIKKYGRPRKSKVIKDNDEQEAKISKEKFILGISVDGIVKKLSLKKESSIGIVGKGNEKITVLDVRNCDDLLVFDSSGKISKVSISAIPEMKYEDTGIELARYFSVTDEIISVMKITPKTELSKKDDNLCIVFVTKMGFAKKVLLSEFDKISDFKIGIKLNPGDKLVGTIFAFDKSSKDIIICTNIGNGVRLKIADIKTLGKQAKGLPQINLKEGEYVVNACRIKPREKYLFYITSAGRVKLTETKYFPPMKRKDESLSLIQLNKNENLVGVMSVKLEDKVFVYRKNSDPTELNIADIPIKTRIASGEKMIKTPKGDYVVGYKVFQ